MSGRTSRRAAAERSRRGTTDTDTESTRPSRSRLGPSIKGAASSPTESPADNEKMLSSTSSPMRRRRAESTESSASRRLKLRAATPSPSASLSPSPSLDSLQSSPTESVSSLDSPGKKPRSSTKGRKPEGRKRKKDENPGPPADADAENTKPDAKNAPSASSPAESLKLETKNLKGSSAEPTSAKRSAHESPVSARIKALQEAYSSPSRAKNSSGPLSSISSHKDTRSPADSKASGSAEAMVTNLSRNVSLNKSKEKLDGKEGATEGDSNANTLGSDLSVSTMGKIGANVALPIASKDVMEAVKAARSYYAIPPKAMPRVQAQLREAEAQGSPEKLGRMAYILAAHHAAVLADALVTTTKGHAAAIETEEQLRKEVDKLKADLEIANQSSKSRGLESDTEVQKAENQKLERELQEALEQLTAVKKELQERTAESQDAVNEHSSFLSSSLDALKKEHLALLEVHTNVSKSNSELQNALDDMRMHEKASGDTATATKMHLEAEIKQLLENLEKKQIAYAELEEDVNDLKKEIKELQTKEGLKVESRSLELNKLQEELDDAKELYAHAQEKLISTVERMEEDHAADMEEFAKKIETLKKELAQVKEEKERLEQEREAENERAEEKKIELSKSKTIKHLKTDLSILELTESRAQADLEALSREFARMADNAMEAEMERGKNNKIIINLLEANEKLSAENEKLHLEVVKFPADESKSSLHSLRRKYEAVVDELHLEHVKHMSDLIKSREEAEEALNEYKRERQMEMYERSTVGTQTLFYYTADNNSDEEDSISVEPEPPEYEDSEKEYDDEKRRSITSRRSSGRPRSAIEAKEPELSQPEPREKRKRNSKRVSYRDASPGKLEDGKEIEDDQKDRRDRRRVRDNQKNIYKKDSEEKEKDNKNEEEEDYEEDDDDEDDYDDYRPERSRKTGRQKSEMQRQKPRNKKRRNSEDYDSDATSSGSEEAYSPHETQNQQRAKNKKGGHNQSSRDNHERSRTPQSRKVRETKQDPYLSPEPTPEDDVSSPGSPYSLKKGKAHSRSPLRQTHKARARRR